MTTDLATTTVPTTPTRLELGTPWSLSAAGGPVPEHLTAALVAGSVPATVPGCVHTDLLAAGLIPDPYLDNNEALLAWIGQVDWTYRTTFRWTPDGRERQDLVFEGLDTVATVRLNGSVVLKSANQHRSYRVDVGALLLDGDNALEVAFRSPIAYANAQSLALGARPRPYPLPYEAIRKSAASFGWDWGIATYTSGIWRPARLESWSVARIAESRIEATPTATGGRVEASLRIERAPGHEDDELEVTTELAGERSAAALPAGADEVDVAMEAAGTGLWWPVGYGEQPLYDVALELSDRRSPHPIDAVVRRVGFRTVAWNTTPDEAGTPFTLEVNGVPVYVKGVNWIPDDALTSRIDRPRYERRLRQAVAGGVNLVRVWGGGIYEPEAFYDVCDELGLLTWQDFLFACAAYPEEEPIRSEVEAEARENIVRLASHASLVLLTGNNENLWGYEDWGWKTSLDGLTWGEYYYLDLFPRLVAELAPHVPYAPGSPFSPGGEHPNYEPCGTMHLWEQWNRRDYATYREHRPRFVAEFGWQGPPAWSTLTRSVHDDPLTPESPGMVVHQKAMEGNSKLTNGLLPHFRMQRDMESWHWAMQLNQAHAVGFALDHFRSLAPHNSGAIVWQLNDCWPVTSWAAIDGDGVLKPLWHALRRSFAPRTVTVQPTDGGLAAVLSNDTPGAWSGTLAVRRVSFDNETLAGTDVEFFVGPRQNATVPLEPSVATAGDPGAEVLVVSALAAEPGFWYFAEPRDSQLADAELTFETVPVEGGTVVRATAGNFVRDLTLLVDKVHPEAVTEEGLVTLLPGETASFLVLHPEGVEPAGFLAPRVVRTANELVAGAVPPRGQQ